MDGVVAIGRGQCRRACRFRGWRVADPRHQQVIEQMGGGLNLLRNPTLRSVPRSSLLHSLNAPSSRRRFVSGSLSVLGIALLAGFLGRRYGWLPEAGSCRPGLVSDATSPWRMAVC
jgi:transmembrane sensor